MTQNDDSGNRWEPEARPADPTEPIRPADPAPANEAVPPDEYAVAGAPAEPPAAGPRRIRDRARALRGNRTAIVGGAVAAVLAVGAAGFGVGWAASPDDDGPGRFGGPDDHHRFPADFPGGDGDGDGQFSPGQPTVPDSESFSQSSWYVVPSGASGTRI